MKSTRRETEIREEVLTSVREGEGNKYTSHQITITDVPKDKIWLWPVWWLEQKEKQNMYQSLKKEGTIPHL